MAMHNAAENAGEVIEGLTLTANKERQSSITTELMEVVSGSTPSTRPERAIQGVMGQMASSEDSHRQGPIVQIMGPVVDVSFAGGRLPRTYDALEIARKGGRLVLEVEQDLGNGVVRTIAMDTTDGLRRGDEVVSTGQPITVPVGEVTWAGCSTSSGTHRRDAGAGRRAAPHPPQAPARQRAGREPADPGDRDQGHDSSALLQGVQDRALRRGGCRQDRRRQRDDPQHRRGAQRLLGLRRGRERTGRAATSTAT